jgi:Mrp family chromosome partitioning ATPase
MSRLLQALKEIEARSPAVVAAPERVSPEELGAFGLARPLEPWNAVPAGIAEPRAACGEQVEPAEVALALEMQSMLAGSLEVGLDWKTDAETLDALADFDGVLSDDRSLADPVWPDLEHTQSAAEPSGPAAPLSKADSAGGAFERASAQSAVEREFDPEVAVRSEQRLAVRPPPRQAVMEESTAAGKADSAAGDLAYWHLAENILAQVPHAGPVVLMFSSPAAAARKTAVVAQLARMLARRFPGEVVAVDADAQGAGLAAQFGLESSRGLADILSGRASWRDALQTVDHAGPGVIPRGAGRYGGRLEVESRPLRSLVDSLRRHARLVVVNAPPLTSEAAPPLLPLGDALYLVVRIGHTPRRAAAEAVARLQQSGAPLYGCILTGA